MGIRAGTTADADVVAGICLKTGAAGGDATGLFADDAVLSDVYATPYLFGPGGFCLLWEREGRVVGYVLGTDETEAFQRWFSEEWWPSRPSRTPRTEGDAWLLPLAANPTRMLEPVVPEFPAHVHIDLLPEAQGQGAGRQLIEAAVALLAERGAPGVHLGVDPANAGARAFYPRVGFTQASAGESVLFVRKIDAA